MEFDDLILRAAGERKSGGIEDRVGMTVRCRRPRKTALFLCRPQASGLMRIPEHHCTE